MDHFEALQKLLTQYKAGLMTAEEYERFVRHEMAKREVNDMAEKYWR